jgi:hypothetical protein
MFKDRRNFPRLEVDTSSFTGELVDSRMQIITLRDLAQSGFSVESRRACVVGTRHMFRFVTDGGLAVRVGAEAVYSRPIESNREAVFVNGFKFIADTPEASAAVDLLVDSATAPLSFE